MNLKSQKGSIILYTLVAMFVITTIAIMLFVKSANKQQTQLEASMQIQQIYNNGQTPEEAYQKYLGNEVVPIKDGEQLSKIGTGETVFVDGKAYVLAKANTYVLRNDIILNPELEVEFKNVQKLIDQDQITFEGQKHTITIKYDGMESIYSEDNNYQIEDVNIFNEQGFAKFRDKVNEGKTYKGSNITLKSNLDLTELNVADQKTSWVPIGTEANKFAGNFEGNNNIIKELYIKGTAVNTGLFGHNSGTIQNLTLENGYVESSYERVGMVVRKKYRNNKKCINKWNS